MDLSDYFKKHLSQEFAKLHKATKTKTVQDRKEDLMRERKSKRDTLAFARRNIDIDNMSEYNTPILQPQQKVKHKVDLKKDNADGVNKRLEMLAKWKAEKAKQKQLEKANKRPLFKVCHLESDLAINLENVNKLIKGKAILTSALKKSQFAPDSHTFRAPSGIKPFNFKYSSTKPKDPENRNKSNLKPQKSTATPIFPKRDLSKSRYFISTPSFPKSETPKQRISYIDKEVVFNKTPKKTSVSNTKASKDIQVKINIKDSLSQVNSNNSLKISLRSKRRINTSTPNPIVASVDRNRATPTTSSSSNTIKSSVTLLSKNKTTPILARSNSVTSNTSGVVSKPPIKTTKSNISTPKASEKSLVKSSTSARQIDTRKALVNHKNVSDSKSSNDKIPVKKTPKNSNEKKEDINEMKAENTGSVLSNKQTKTPVTKTPLKTPLKLTEKKKDINKSLIILVEDDAQKGPGTPTYVSPFVTISRGKRNAREEFKIRRSLGTENPVTVTPEIAKLMNVYTSPRAGADYFMVKLDNEIERILKICENWETYLQDSELVEEAKSSIDVAIGQSRLLIAKKFEQFRGLIFECQTKNYKEKAITCEDLHGFWDMIYMQVEDLDKRFENLERMKANNWAEMLLEKKPVVKKSPAKKTRKTRAKKGIGGKSRIKDMIKAAREKQKTEKADGCEDEKTFNGGYFEIRTPLKEEVPQVNPSSATASSKRRSLRVSILTVENKNRCSSSPGLTMMKVSQSIKQNNGLTPAKSILKTDGCKSTGKKSVAFKDSASPKALTKTNLFNMDREKNRKSLNFSDEEKENEPSPSPLRRSTRLNR